MKMLLTALCLTSALSFAAGLKKGSAAEVKADFDLICNAVKRSGAEKETDTSTRARKVAEYMLKNIKTEQAMGQMQEMASLKPEYKADALREAAKKAGYTGVCPFADEK